MPKTLVTSEVTPRQPAIPEAGAPAAPRRIRPVVPSSFRSLTA